MKFERVTDKARQIRGVDVVLKGKDGTLRVNVDEKAKYWNLQHGEELKNYSFEINRICRDGERRLGWFADSRNITDYYCFAFPKFEDPDDPRSPVKPGMRFEMFRKSDVIGMILKESSMQEITDRAWQMVAEDRSMVRFGGFVLWKTPFDEKPEAPVNLLIKKELVYAMPNFRALYA